MKSVHFYVSASEKLGLRQPEGRRTEKLKLIIPTNVCMSTRTHNVLLIAWDKTKSTGLPVLFDKPFSFSLLPHVCTLSAADAELVMRHRTHDRSAHTHLFSTDFTYTRKTGNYLRDDWTSDIVSVVCFLQTGQHIGVWFLKVAFRFNVM